MKEFLKKSWFVVLVGAILLGVAGYMTFDLISQQLPSKKVDGKDVVFSYNGVDYTTDDLYDDLYASYSFETILTYIELQVYRNAFEPDADLLSEAKIYTNNTIQNLKYQYGEDYKEILSNDLKKLGYSGDDKSLTEYYITYLMQQEVQKRFISENIDTYFPKYALARKPRMVSHILIAVADPENPSEDELAKLDEVKALLAESDADFAAIAMQYSDDTGSGANGGSLGVVDTTTIGNFVENFKNSIYTVGVGEMTEWFQTEYGYHIILVTSESPEDFVETDNFASLILSYYPTLVRAITWSEIERQGLELSGDEALIEKVEKYYKVEIDTSIPESAQ